MWIGYGKHRTHTLLHLCSMQIQLCLCVSIGMEDEFNRMRIYTVLQSQYSRSWYTSIRCGLISTEVYDCSFVVCNSVICHIDGTPYCVHVSVSQSCFFFLMRNLWGYDMYSPQKCKQIEMRAPVNEFNLHIRLNGLMSNIVVRARRISSSSSSFRSSSLSATLSSSDCPVSHFQIQTIRYVVAFSSPFFARRSLVLPSHSYPTIRIDCYINCVGGFSSWRTFREHNNVCCAFF